MSEDDKRPKKVYAVADFVPRSRRSYLTPGKLYPVVWEDGDLFGIADDENFEDDIRCCRWKACLHLEKGDWRRVEQ